MGNNITKDASVTNVYDTRVIVVVHVITCCIQLKYNIYIYIVPLEYHTIC